MIKYMNLIKEGLQGRNPDGFSELPGRKPGCLPAKSGFLPGIPALEAWGSDASEVKYLRGPHGGALWA